MVNNNYGQKGTESRSVHLISSIQQPSSELICVILKVTGQDGCYTAVYSLGSIPGKPHAELQGAFKCDDWLAGLTLARELMPMHIIYQLPLPLLRQPTSLEPSMPFLQTTCIRSRIDRYILPPMLVEHTLL